MNLGLSADLVNNVFAFLNKSCLRDCLSLSGTLLHVSALFLSGGGALLVGDIPHNVCARLLGVSGALLLRDLTSSGGTLGDTSGGAFLLVFCSEVGDSSCVAFRICDCAH